MSSNRISNFFMTAAITVAVFGLTSCDSRQKLSEQLSGVWSGNPEAVADTGAARATMSRMLEFTPTGNEGAGNFTMTAYITVENTMPASDTVVQPMTITASGTATITGVYQVKDDDDVLLNLDASSLSVTVDPEAVELTYNVLTGNDSSQLTQLKSGAVVLASQQIEQAARAKMLHIQEIEDIHIVNNLMSCELSHSDLTFRRQSTDQACLY